MKRDSRLSAALHVLLHLEERGAPTTSEALARGLRTNAVVVRRMLAGLRKRGFVRSEKGHGGGWTLARPLADVTLYDVYAALGRPPLLAIGHRSEAPGCRVERAVNAALGQALDDAESLLLARLRGVTLAQVSAGRRALAPAGVAPCLGGAPSHAAAGGTTRHEAASHATTTPGS